MISSIPQRAKHLNNQPSRSCEDNSAIKQHLWTNRFFPFCLVSYLTLKSLHSSVGIFRSLRNWILTSVPSTEERNRVYFGRCSVRIQTRKKYSRSNFTVRQASEKLLQKGKASYWCFVDLVKALDSLPRSIICQDLNDKGINTGLRMAIQSLYKKN